MKLQDKYLALGNNGCLALCYLTAAAYDAASDEEKNIYGYIDTMVSTIALAALGTRELSEDAFVLDAERLMTSVANNKYKVTKKIAESWEDVPKTGWCCVNFVNGNFNHWILAKDGFRFFDSKENSECVKNGKIADLRIIERV